MAMESLDSMAVQKVAISILFLPEKLISRYRDHALLSPEQILQPCDG